MNGGRLDVRAAILIRGHPERYDARTLRLFAGSTIRVQLGGRWVGGLARLSYASMCLLYAWDADCITNLQNVRTTASPSAGASSRSRRSSWRHSSGELLLFNKQTKKSLPCIQRFTTIRVPPTHRDLDNPRNRVRQFGGFVLVLGGTFNVLGCTWGRFSTCFV